MIDQFLCIVSQTDMIKFFNEIDENGNKDIFFSNSYWLHFLNKLIIRFSEQSVCYKSGVDVRDNLPWEGKTANTM